MIKKCIKNTKISTFVKQVFFVNDLSFMNGRNIGCKLWWICSIFVDLCSVYLVKHSLSKLLQTNYFPRYEMLETIFLEQFCIIENKLLNMNGLNCDCNIDTIVVIVLELDCHNS